MILFAVGHRRGAEGADDIYYKNGAKAGLTVQVPILRTDFIVAQASRVAWSLGVSRLPQGRVCTSTAVTEPLRPEQVSDTGPSRRFFGRGPRRSSLPMLARARCE